jgi:hypothetical protein
MTKEQIEQKRERRRAYILKWRAANRKKIAASGRAYYITNREKILARNREYKAANHDRILTQKRKYNAANYAANRERVAARKCAWHAANMGKVAEIHALQKARKHNARGGGNLKATEKVYQAMQYFRQLGFQVEVDHETPFL